MSAGEEKEVEKLKNAIKQVWHAVSQRAKAVMSWPVCIDLYRGKLHVAFPVSPTRGGAGQLLVFR